MVTITRSDLRKLAALCDDRRYADELVRDNAVDGVTYSYSERSLADNEAVWLKALSARLLKAVETGAKRIEVV